MIKTILFFNISGIGGDTGINTYCKQFENYILQNPHKDYKFYFISLNSNEGDGFNVIKTNHINYVNIPAPIISRQRFNSIFQPIYGKTVADLLKTHIQINSSIIIHLNWIDLGVMASSLKTQFDEKWSCKIVLTRHCLPSRSLLHTNYSEFLKAYKYSMTDDSEFLQNESRHYYSIDQFITVTECSKIDLEKNFGISEKKISIIRNGVIHAKPNGLTKAIHRQNYGFSNKEKILVYVGRDEKSIGLNWLLKSFKKLIQENYNIRLIVVGKIRIEDLTKDNSEIMSRVTMMGFVEQKKLFEIFQLSDLGVIPSAYEQCSYTAIEMMNCKLPILVSSVDGLKEMIIDKMNGFTFSVSFGNYEILHDSDELREKIKFALDKKNANLIKKITNVAKQQVKTIYNIKKMGDAIINVYNSIL